MQKWKFTLINQSDDIIKENTLAIETKQIKWPGINKYEVPEYPTLPNEKKMDHVLGRKIQLQDIISLSKFFYVLSVNDPQKKEIRKFFHLFKCLFIYLGIEEELKFMKSNQEE